MDEVLPNDQDAVDLSPPPVEAPPDADPEAPPAAGDPTPVAEPGAAAPVQPFDFRKSAILPAREFRRLWQRQEEFARNLADRLSLHLRREFSLKLSDLDTLAYGEFIGGLAMPTHLSLFKLEPLRGVCLLDLPPRLGLAIVDRLLGGPGVAPATRRDLSEIELALLEQVVKLTLEEWCRSWRDTQQLTPVLLGHETNGKFVQAAAHDLSMLVQSLDAKLGECGALVQLAMPFHALTPLVRELAPRPVAAGPERTPAATAPTPLRPGWDDIPIPAAAEWHDLELTARELSGLKVGDVIQLAPECAGRVRVRLAGEPKFLGRLGMQTNRWAVQLTQPLKT